MKDSNLTKSPATWQQEASEIPDVANNIKLFDSIKEVTQCEEDPFYHGYVLVIVRSGHGIIDTGGARYDLRAGDVFFTTQKEISNYGMYSLDIEMFGCFMTKEYAEQLSEITPIDIPSLSIISEHNRLHMPKEGMEIVLMMHRFMKYAMMKPDGHDKNCILHHLKQAFATEIHMLFESRDEDLEPQSIKYNSAAQIYQRFLDLLNTSPKPLHSVTEVAKILSITPKYFSNICKQISGRTASSIINEKIVNRARILLRNPDNSIKQVSDTLGFANQSHFGTFMRRHTGMSPVKFRHKAK